MDEPALADARVPRRSRALDLRSASLTSDLGVVCGVALVAGLIRLGTPSIWVDEAFTARGVTYSLGELQEQVHWVYYVSIRPWIAVAGSSEWALRLPSVAAAVVACALLVVLARRLFDRRVALVSGLLLATNTFVVQWSQQARSYTLLLAASVLSALFLLRALERQSRAAWGIHGAAFSLIVLLQPVAGLALAPVHLALALMRRDRLVPHALLSPVAIVAIGGSWAGVVALRTRGESGVSWIDFPTPLAVADAVAEVSGVAGFGVVLALLGLWILHRLGRVVLAAWLGVWAFAPFLVVVGASVLKPMFVDRYLIVCAPAFALLGGVTIRELMPRLRVLAVAATIIATGAALVSWYTFDGRDNWRGENWREAVETVIDRRTTEPIVVVPWWANPAPAYYDAAPVDTSTADRMWVLVWSEDGHHLTVDVRRPLGFGEHRLVELRQFGWRVSAQLWER